MKNLAVYCGSSPGFDDVYTKEAQRLGRILAEKEIGIVYGGGKVGLMGSLADAALDAGGKVCGVIPEFLDTLELGHDGLEQLIRVESMHERKALIEKKSDGAIALPGGFGTLDEFFEMLTWGQLGLHKKPVGLLNTNGFFNHLLAAIEHMVKEGFLRDVNRDMLLYAEDPRSLLEMMQNYVPPLEGKWIMDKRKWKSI
ncbi:MAG: TIGR00730 family Rossman fold protein [Bacteroidetes bacterium]|nr:MAG: TIGR00730 family Rossman fold protein [Bacteroidota bacterium]